MEVGQRHSKGLTVSYEVKLRVNTGFLSLGKQQFWHLYVGGTVAMPLLQMS